MRKRRRQFCRRRFWCRLREERRNRANLRRKPVFIIKSFAEKRPEQKAYVKRDYSKPCCSGELSLLQNDRIDRGGLCSAVVGFAEGMEPGCFSCKTFGRKRNGEIMQKIARAAGKSKGNTCTFLKAMIKLNV